MYDELFAAPKVSGKVGRPRTVRAEGELPSTNADKKQSVYFGDELIAAIKLECARQDRSFSWVVCECVRRALPELQSMASVEEISEV